MRTDPDRFLLFASSVFAGAACLGSAAAIRDQLPGQPLGISVPLSVRAGLLAGWGAGVAAPWPMPVTALIAAASIRRTGPSALAGAACAGIGAGCLLGTAIEPVTWRPHSWSPVTTLAIITNMVASVALTAAGWRHLAAARSCCVHPAPWRSACPGSFSPAAGRGRRGPPRRTVVSWRCCSGSR